MEKSSAIHIREISENKYKSNSKILKESSYLSRSCKLKLMNLEMRNSDLIKHLIGFDFNKVTSGAKRMCKN